MKSISNIVTRALLISVSFHMQADLTLINLSGINHCVLCTPAILRCVAYVVILKHCRSRPVCLIKSTGNEFFWIMLVARAEKSAVGRSFLS